MQIIINLDVDDLERAVLFYTRAFGLKVSRRFNDGSGAELLGGGAPMYLLDKARGTPAAPGLDAPRDYGRHWTPVHLDFVVDNVDETVQVALEAGATLEIPAATYEWGRIAQMSDPFGHGLCILQFIGKGYDAVATAIKGPEPGTHF